MSGSLASIVVRSDQARVGVSVAAVRAVEIVEHTNIRTALPVMPNLPYTRKILTESS